MSERTTLSIDEAAKRLNVSTSYVEDLLRDGEIVYVTISGVQRIDAIAFEAYAVADDAKRLEMLDELTAEAQRLGLGY